MLDTIKKIGGNILDAVKRFPLPILSALGAFICIWLSLYAEHISQQQVCFKLFLEFLCGIPLFSAFSLMALRQQLDLGKKIGLLLLGISVLSLHFYSIPNQLFESDALILSRFGLFFFSYNLLCSLVAFQQINEIKSFWNYNQYLFSNWVITLLFSLALCLGFGSALWAIDRLFGFHWHSNYYIILWAGILLLFQTIFFFFNFPKRFDVFKEQTDYKQWLRIFVEYVLMPLVVVYMITLYAYAFKILMYRMYPKGWVCVPILTFASLGILAYLLAYPIRLNKEHRIIYLFSNYFFYTLLPLLALYFISIFLRISSYGITENRYLVVVLGIWLLVTSVYLITSTIDNIITIPISLLVILFLSSIGPWGMFQLSVHNQFARLKRNLLRNGLLENGQLVPAADHQVVSEADASNIHSMLNFLNRRGSVNIIRPWLNEKDQQILQKVIETNEIWNLHAIFSIDAKTKISDDVANRFQISTPNLWGQNRGMDISGYKRMFSFHSSFENATKDSNDLWCSLEQNNLTLRSWQAVLVETSLDSFLHLIHGWIKQRSITDSNRTSISVIDLYNKEFQFSPDSLSLPITQGKLLFEQIESEYIGDSLHLVRAQGYFLQK